MEANLSQQTFFFELNSNVLDLEDMEVSCTNPLDEYMSNLFVCASSGSSTSVEIVDDNARTSNGASHDAGYRQDQALAAIQEKCRRSFSRKDPATFRKTRWESGCSTEVFRAQSPQFPRRRKQVEMELERDMQSLVPAETISLRSPAPKSGSSVIGIEYGGRASASQSPVETSL